MAPHEKALYRARTAGPRSPAAVSKAPSRAHELAAAETLLDRLVEIHLLY